MSDIQDQLSRMRRDAEERDAQRRASSYGLSYLAPEKVSVSLDALGLIPEEKAKQSQCAIIAIKGKRIAVIACDSKFSGTSAQLKELETQGYSVNLFIVSLSSLLYAFSFYKFVQKERGAISGKVRVGSQINESSDTSSEKTVSQKGLDTITAVHAALENRIAGGQISDMVDTLLAGALGTRASDIHLEPGDSVSKLRYRIDGNLNDVHGSLSNNIYHSIVSRIKLLSNLKLNVKDEPQDGRFTINFPNKDVQVRVALAPSEFGEVVVMRLLDPDAINLSLSDLGLRDDDRVIVEEQLAKPYGMALNTGPTGSGKTTTLYAFLRHKITPEVKIITIEDPIEYHLDGIQQTQVDNEAGYTFASGLRSLMRQDPDVILVGEIRDKETAEIGVQAALTGHLVFSTVHANEAAGAIPRLFDLGVKAASLAPALNLLIAQRLVRRLCSSCKEKDEAINADIKEKIKARALALPARVNGKKFVDACEFYKPAGCEKCNNTGFKGRVGIYELLVVTDSLRALIQKEVGQIEFQQAIAHTDFVSMQSDGVLKVMSGLTTLEEVESVTGKIAWGNPDVKS